MTDRIALHYVPDADGADGFDGADAYSAGLLRALAHEAAIERIGCFGAGDAQARAFEARLREQGYGGRVERIAQGRPQDLAHFGTLCHPAPDVARLAWRRLGIGERRYSLCGLADGTASHAAMGAVADLLVAPLRSWDAVICTARVVRDSVRQILERQADYLAARLGAQRFEPPQLPLIPPGVHGADLRIDPARRAEARRRLDIGDDDVAFLSLGALSCEAGAHPQQMFSALERAQQQRMQRAARPGQRVHLILCGWSGGAAAQQALRAAAALFCPSIRLVLMGGEVRGEGDAKGEGKGEGEDHAAEARAAADVFTSLADKVRASCGQAPLAAMAAGLPCVVSDWGGHRDTVRDGVDGYRIPTVMPGAGAGLDLAQRYDDDIDSFDLYCGHTSQAVALDGARLAEAYGRLIDDAGLRRQLGANARRRALQEFDWTVVMGRYRALWSELDERRRADAVLAPALPQVVPVVPDRQDPFALFAAYPSAQITPVSLVELAPDASLALLRQYGELAINRFAAGSLPTLEEFGQIFGSIESQPMQVDELLDTLGPCDRPTLLRGLAWLCKMDLLRIRADGE